MSMEVTRFDNGHLMGEHATHPIVYVLGHQALLLLFAWCVVVADLSALQPRPAPCG